MTTHVVAVFEPQTDRFGRANVALGFDLADDPKTLGWKISKKVQALRAHTKAFHTDAFRVCPLCSMGEYLSASEKDIIQNEMAAALVIEPCEGMAVGVSVCTSDNRARAASWLRGDETPYTLDGDHEALGRMVLDMAGVPA